MSDAPPPQAGEETIHVADNVDEFVQRSRWQQILEAREEARDALRSASLQRAQLRSDGLDHQEARRLSRESLRGAVESYVLEAEPIYQRTEPGQKLWGGVDLAMVALPDLFVANLGEDEEVADVEIVTRDGTEFVVRRRDEGTPVVQLRGVQDYLALARAYVRYQVVGQTLDRLGNPKADREETVRASTPVNVSREAFRATNALLNHVGPGFEIGAETGAVENDYSDLLDDVTDE